VIHLPGSLITPINKSKKGPELSLLAFRLKQLYNALSTIIEEFSSKPLELCFILFSKPKGLGGYFA
jgi:hypothetical protein